ncbi:MAG TPA: NADH-quinone oxidoreductase subunit A [Nitrospiraceae bacterium]|nr:NADH-quinone oxidoreductase subunit A [Nitrospiraceae bacterium]
MNGNAWAFIVYGGAVLVIVAGMLGLSYILGERHDRKPERRAEAGIARPYESGMNPTGSAHLRLSIQYYLMAMLFVIFDLEAVFLYAWAIAVPETGWMGFAEMSLFVGILLVALFYLWRVGALDWGAQYQRHQTPVASREKDQDVFAA